MLWGMRMKASMLVKRNSVRGMLAAVNLPTTTTMMATLKEAEGLVATRLVALHRSRVGLWWD